MSTQVNSFADVYVLSRNASVLAPGSEAQRNAMVDEYQAQYKTLTAAQQSEVLSPDEFKQKLPLHTDVPSYGRHCEAATFGIEDRRPGPVTTDVKRSNKHWADVYYMNRKATTQLRLEPRAKRLELVDIYGEMYATLTDGLQAKVSTPDAFRNSLLSVSGPVAGVTQERQVRGTITVPASSTVLTKGQLLCLSASQKT